MLLLVFATIWIYKKFRDLALIKGYPSKTWGAWGCVTYLGVSFGLQFLVGILAGLEIIDLDYESDANNLIMSLIGYAVGGGCTYLLYVKYEKKEDITPNIDDFGLAEEKENNE